MQSSCITHPPDNPVAVVRGDYYELCDHNEVAAALLALFEFWHTIKLRHQPQARHKNIVALSHGEAPAQDEDLWQWHTEETLEKALLGIGRRDAIRQAIKLLSTGDDGAKGEDGKEKKPPIIGKNFISVGLNPNPRYKFDRTRYFLFNAEAVQAAINKKYRPSGPLPPSSPPIPKPQNLPTSPENQGRETENQFSLHENTSENTNKNKVIDLQAAALLQPQNLQKVEGTATTKGEKPAASAKPSAREAEPTACEILHSFVRRNNPHWSPTIHDQETINAKVPASELPAFSDFVSNWFLDYPNTRHASKILTAYAEQSAKRKLETERASQGANDLKELARRIEHSRQQDIKLANERRANRGNDQPVASGTARPASEPPPARRPYCLPESFVGTVWATPDARRDAVRVVEDESGDELPDFLRPMGVAAQSVHTTVNA